MVEVSAGVIVRNAQVLVCQRDYGAMAGLWEFPGGKRESKETPEGCLVRECREELGITVLPERVLLVTRWATSDAAPATFYFILASIKSGEPQCLEHRDIRWVSPSSLPSFTFCPADAAVLDQIIAQLTT